MSADRRERLRWVGSAGAWVLLAVGVAAAGSWFVWTNWKEPVATVGGLRAGPCPGPTNLTTPQLSVVAALGQMDFSLDATLAPDDVRTRDLENLVSGTTTLPQFVDRLLDELTVDDVPVWTDFESAVACVSSSRDGVALHASAVRSGVTKIGTGRFTARRTGNVSTYTLRLAVRDYTVLAYDPRPTTLAGGVAVWADEQGVPPWTVVAVAHQYDPLAHPLTVLRRSPLELVSPEYFVIARLLNAIALAIPVVWALGLIRPRPADPDAPAAFDRLLRPVLRGLLALGLAGSAVQAADVPQVGAVLVEAFGATGLPPDLADAMLVPLAVAALVAVGGALAFLLARGRAERWATLTADIARSLLYAGLVALAVGAAVLAFGRLPPSSYTVPAAIVGACLLAPLVAWARLLVAGRREIGHRRRETALAAGAVLLWALLAIPGGTNIASLQPLAVSTADRAAEDLRLLVVLLQGLYVPAYLVALGVILLLGQRGGAAPAHAEMWGWAGLLFAAILIGTRANIFLVPVPFFIALYLFPRFVLIPQDEQEALDAVADRVRAERPQMLRRVLGGRATDVLQQGSVGLAQKVSGGDLTVEEYRERSRAIETFLEEQAAEREVLPGLGRDDVVLTFGPLPSQWENGIVGVSYGLLVAAPLLLPNLVGYLAGGIGQETPYFPLTLADQLVGTVGYWLVGAFAFGFFLPYIRGESGLTKGLRLSVTAVACLLPAWLLPVESVADAVAVLVRAGQTVLFFAVLGAWAFDYRTFRRALGADFTWTRFARFGGLGNVTAASSVLLASAGLAVGSVLSGQLSAILSALVQLAFPQVPPPAAGP